MIDGVGCHGIACKISHMDVLLLPLDQIDIVVADNAHGFQVIDYVSHILFVRVRQVDKHLIQWHLSCHFQYIVLICVDLYIINDHTLAFCIHTRQGNDLIVDLQRFL